MSKPLDEASQDAIAVLHSIMLDEEVETKTRVAAAKALLDAKSRSQTGDASVSAAESMKAFADMFKDSP